MKWQPIETAPKDGTMILIWPITKKCYLAGEKYVGSAYWHQPANPASKGFWVCSWKTERPTHWMPLPDPPEAP